VGRKIKGCSRRIRADSLAALLMEPAYAACEELADGADARVGREGVVVVCHGGAGRAAPLPLYFRSRAKSPPLSWGLGKIVGASGDP
jgi:hypothetical protein